ncbi:histidine kinase [Aphanothece hegewaldii CCALA 016]|uniref:histidine kinase n=1 Tax=Aphanothece hegewaldii CCALA 016 TaxID=2107694 RepID=A0A2T1M3Z5_9CHRO|nr:hybrid sensor histidine kinase/response regulator [Aphanothece hegewaldii]PSF39555.1 histidine kinase [Aphanothece hegewaldii CCALA 016]
MDYSRTLLIVDDCREDRETYRRYLLKDSQQSYCILEAESAEEGLILCQKVACDVILLDFQLPEMNGLEFLDELRQNYSSLPVIMLTAYGDEAIAVQAMKIGAQDYLAKNHLKPDILQLAVRSALERSHLQTQLKKTQERQRLIATIALRIRQSLELEQILKTAILEIQKLLNCDRVVVCRFEETANNLLGSDGHSLKVQHQKVCYQLGTQNDQQSSLSNICEVGNYSNGLDSGINDNLEIPIILGSPKPDLATPWGLLVVYQYTQERQWHPEEVEMLKQVSVQLALAIQQAELLAKTQVALEEEKKLNALKSQIIATVSHEYRTPLAAILAAASTMKLYGEQLETTKQQRFLQLIENKSRYMSRLVDDMLTLSRFEQQKADFNPIPLDIPKFFAALLEEYRQNISDLHEFSLKQTGNFQDFSADHKLLKKIFDNLLSNAVKYSPDGGKIKINIIGQGLQVLVHIQDEGIGIPQDEQSSIFQSFRRGSNIDTIPGTGLGLSIVSAGIELHGGEISLKSQLGKGTKVTVILPKLSRQEYPSP